MELSRIGQYFVERQIAFGGQGKIYQVSNGQQLFAIKVYDSVQQRQNDLFSKEKELMQTLQHQSILSPLEYKDNQTIILTNGQETKRNIVIMKYMTNGDLMNEVLRNGRIDSKILLKIVRPLVDCLTYLSKRETFHCDLKPENILLSEEYQPLLIDFGFVATQFLSKQKEYPKQYYIAPQVKKGLSYNQKSEAFSLGVLIFILSMGCLPFKQTRHTDPSFRSLLQGKSNNFWRSFEQNLNFSLDENLKNVIINLIEPNPKRRWNYDDLRESEWFNEQLISQKQYLQYFLQRQNHKKNKQEQSNYECHFNDSQETASKSMVDQST